MLRPTVLLSALSCLPLFSCATSPAAREASPPAAMRAEDVRPLAVGARAPAPVLETMDGDAAPLASHYAAGPTLLIFYRGSWCPFCQRHLEELARVESDVRAAGVRIVAISPDRPDEVAKHAAKSPGIAYTLLSDSDARAAREFGLAFKVDDAGMEMLRGYGIDLERASGRDHHLLPTPAVYLVDREGIVRFAHYDPDYKQRLSGEEVLAAARSIGG